jgi:hypothetical protein
VTALRSEYPLTRFLGTLLNYTREQLAKADPQRAAEHFGISAEHAAEYIRQQCEIKGVSVKRWAA